MEKRCLFAALAEVGGYDWRRFLQTMAIEAWDPVERVKWVPFGESLRRVEILDRDLAMKVSDNAGEVISEALDFGVVLGYAIAKTAPNGVEGLANWLDRAIAYAGLGTEGKASE